MTTKAMAPSTTKIIAVYFARRNALPCAAVTRASSTASGGIIGMMYEASLELDSEKNTSTTAHHTSRKRSTWNTRGTGAGSRRQRRTFQITGNKDISRMGMKYHQASACSLP